MEELDYQKRQLFEPFDSENYANSVVFYLDWEHDALVFELKQNMVVIWTMQAFISLMK